MIKKTKIILWKEKFKDWLDGNGFGIGILTLFSFILVYAIFSKLYFLQITKHKELSEISLKQSYKTITNPFQEGRGKIFFKSKNEDILVAIQKNEYKVIVDNKDDRFFKKNKKENIEKLEKIFNFNLKKINKNDPYNIIAKEINEEEKEKVKKIGLKYLYFEKDKKRFYPFKNIGSKIIGFVDNQNNGVAGLEKYYNKELKKTSQKKKIRKNILNFIEKDIQELKEKDEFYRKGDIYTSIDINVQNFLEKKVEEINQKYSSKKTFALIIKPATGKIIAMADNQKLDFNVKKSDYRNNIIESRYEPGSIIKPLIVAIALDSNSINKNFKYYDTGCIKVQDKNICNFDKRGRGPNTDLVKVIRDSLNVGMVHIIQHIKKEIYLKYLIKFGLSEESGIDLPNEISQDISSLDYKINLNYATSAFGQGTSFSPIAMARALSILANNGYLITPHIVNKIEYDNYEIAEQLKYPKTKVLKDKTSQEIEDIIIKAVNNSPSKQKYQNKLYNVGAKTGTAQIPSKNGGYKKGVNLHTFFGFFPAKGPMKDRYLILFYTFEPKAKYSSQTLIKPFYETMDFLISYYDIKPDRLK